MRPGQTRPNEFEIAILDRLARKEPSLEAAIGALHVLNRKFTGVGSFTNLKCEEQTADAPEDHLGLGALITMPGVPNGMGAVLFRKGSQPLCLEIFTYGDDHWDGVYDGYALEETA